MAGPHNVATWTLPDVFAGPPDATAGTLTSYFTKYTGRYFERLAGGGDAPGTRNAITPADLVAVSMLSVNVSGEAAIALLDTHAAQIAGLLERIPTDVALHDAGDEHIGPGSPAWALWKLLRSRAVPDVGRTTASKLMARKRPHLIPVQDADVCAELGHTHKADYWATLRKYLRERERGDGLTLAEWLRQARAASGIGEDISDIRAFDVLVWMRHQAEERRAQDNDASPSSS